ncbi:N-acetyltransferase [Pleurocapsa sp. PCC 7319]|uniref:GNAT family N-acetyltransferase n=1 Tax=Pleurocapsa sp. PCC 7319 TaxID=118161 RepID=UPI000345E30C|nr:GNAT family N-acetyltransferase [Pleurocapsa sp. PCC 7319]
MFIKSDKDNIIFNDTNSEERREFINNKLFEFNQAQSEKVVECDRLKTDPPTFIEIYAEIKPQKLVGGLVSYIDWARWLYIDRIWVDANYRKQGIGQYLIKFVEQKAINKGIKRVRLCTFDFQALPFYKKLGYKVYGELEDFPEGHTLYYLKKVLLN